MTPRGERCCVRLRFVLDGADCCAPMLAASCAALVLAPAPLLLFLSCGLQVVQLKRS